MTARRLACALVLTAAITLDVAACFALAEAVGARNDLFPRWLATRLWLTAGQDLYSPATDESIRLAMGATPLAGGRFVFGFVYPAYVAVLLAPLALLPFTAAATIWLLLAQLTVVGGTLLAWRAVERERSLAAAPAAPALVVAALLPATVMNLLFLQFSALAFGALAAAWWLAGRRAERRAAAALMVSLVKPQLALLPVAALVARAAASGRRWLLGATVAMGAMVIVGSLALYPGWVGRFAESAQNYASVARPVSAATLLGRSATGGAAMGVAVGALILALVAARWWHSNREQSDGLGAASLLSTWLVPPLYEWNSVVLLLVIAPALRTLRMRSVRSCWLGVAALVALSVGTLGAYTARPSESRLIWPTLALGIYLWVAPPRGSQSVSSSGPSPTRAAGA